MPTESVQFHPEASAEYDAAFDWYLERSAEAAIAFDAEVNQALSDIVAAPQRWAKGPHSTRRYLLRRFPFILVYRERGTGHSDRSGRTHKSKARVLEQPPVVVHSPPPRNVFRSRDARH